MLAYTSPDDGVLKKCKHTGRVKSEAENERVTVFDVVLLLMMMMTLCKVCFI